MFQLQTSLGIELCESALKVVYLAKTFQGNAILAMQTYNLPLEGSIPEKDWDDQAVSFLREFIAENKVSPDEVIIGIPRRKVVTRIVEIPSINKADLDDIMAYEAPRHVPFPIEDTYFDHQIIGESAKNLMSVLIVATQKSYMQRVTDIVRATNLPVTTVEVSSLGIVNNVLLNFGEEMTGHRVIIDFDATICQLMLLDNGKMIYSRAFPSGKRIQKALEWDQEQPWAGKAEDNPNRQAAQKLNTEIQRAFQAAKIIFDPERVEAIIFSGSGSMCTPILDYFFETLHVSPTIFNPVDKFKFEAEQQNLTSYTSTLGLALKGLNQGEFKLNLLPMDLRQVQRNYGLIAMVALAVILVTMVLTWVGMGFYRDKQLLAKINDEIERLESDVEEVRNLKNNYRKLQSDLESFKQIQADSPSVLEILRELTTRIPPSTNIWLQELRLKNNSARIRGRGESPEALIEELENSDLFEGVKLDRIHRGSFDISMNLVNTIATLSLTEESMEETSDEEFEDDTVSDSGEELTEEATAANGKDEPDTSESNDMNEEATVASAENPETKEQPDKKPDVKPEDKPQSKIAESTKENPKALSEVKKTNTDTSRKPALQEKNPKRKTRKFIPPKRRNPRDD